MHNHMHVALVYTLSDVYAQCEERKKNAQYRSAKTYGKVALGLNIANIIYTAVVALVIICAILGSIVAGKWLN